MALSNALHSKEITTAQIRALSFGFFSESEVRVCCEPGRLSSMGVIKRRRSYFWMVEPCGKPRPSVPLFTTPLVKSKPMAAGGDRVLAHVGEILLS